MKNKILWIYLMLFVFVFGLTTTLLILFSIEFNKILFSHELLVGAIVLSSVFCMNTSLILSYIFIKKRRENIKGSFDYYIESQISSTGSGAIIFDKNDTIIWASKFIEDRFGTSIIGRRIGLLSPTFNNVAKSGQTSFRFGHQGFVFAVTQNLQKRIIVFKDVTNEEKILSQYTSEKLVIGEIEIDNFQQMQVTFSEEEIFSSQNVIIKALDKLSEKWNFIYRQYANGKYTFFTDHQALNEIVNGNFQFVKEIRQKKIDNTNLSVSIGIGFGTGNKKLLQKLARDGLNQAHARGGDQIALMELNKKPVYYGSHFELQQSTSRVGISKIANMLSQKLLNSSIENVVIYGHKLADLDSIGAALGIKTICEAYKKEAFIGNVTFDKTTDNVIRRTYLPREIVEVFIRPSKALRMTSEKTLVIIVDTSELDRIENDKALGKARASNVFIFDHHRTNNKFKKIPQRNIYIDANASSASEIVVEIIRFVNRKIKLSPRVAQMLLNGIFLDTSIFTKSVSARTYAAASFLEHHGASSAVSSSIMRISEDALQIINLILQNLQEIKPGYFLASYDAVVPDDYISMAADEILRTQGRKASFVIARTSPTKNQFKMSARGIQTNVQKIAEQVGGGGHFSAAAALSSEPLSVFIDNLRQAIVSEKGE